MKFEQLHPYHTFLCDRVENQFTINSTTIPNFAIKAPELGRCQLCDAYTRWMDARIGHYICSDECQNRFWESCSKKLQEHFEIEKQEAEVASRSRDAWKDIIIVVHNQLPYLKACIESLRRHTKNCTVHIWNNNSDEDMVQYLDGLMNTIKPNEFEYEIHHHPENAGFIEPNNSMAALGKGEYIILLNSDCVVFEGWDQLMLGHLQADPDLGEVGYLGGALDAEGKGIRSGRYGYDIDYVCGFGLCISRDAYDEFGLFNKQLRFAYGEDSDLSLRLKTAGKKILALYSPAMLHYGNKTVSRVQKEGTVDTLKETFEANHQFIKMKWADYLKNDRVLLNKNSVTWRGKDSNDNDTETAG